MPPWFPRPRGDGPDHRVIGWAEEEVSPPTRGWTRHLGLAGLSDLGFPAHAGMDRDSRPPGRPHAGFPRPRGDGPIRLMHVPFLIGVSPPTRGWTLRELLAGLAYVGFPAHAGMDPLTASRAFPALGFPRPRGDGPPTARTTCRAARVSPPTRGWTPVEHPFLEIAAGFPAHAGMDPSSSLRGNSERRFPRPRGDGPPSSLRSTAVGRVSPPTRGWTR